MSLCRGTFFQQEPEYENHNSIQTSFNSKNLDRRFGVTLRDAHGLHLKRAVLAAAPRGAAWNVQFATDSRAWRDSYVDSCEQPLRNLPEHHNPIDFHGHRGGWSADQF